MLRYTIITISLVGSLFFSTLFAWSFIDPVLVENGAREIVRLEIEKRTGEEIRKLENSKLIQLASRMTAQHQAELASLQKQLQDGLPARIARITAEMGKFDCPCRQKIERSITKSMELHSVTLASLNEKLENLIHDKYLETASSLTREFRIFTGANALILMLTAAITWSRQRAAIQTLMPGLVILGAAAITAWFYLYQQNWLHTLLFSDYLGLAYFAYLLLVMTMLSDIAFNRARICSAVITTMLHALGSAIVVSPC